MSSVSKIAAFLTINAATLAFDIRLVIVIIKA
jgi:hypothetical protein